MPSTEAEVEAFVARHWALAHRLIGVKVRWVRDADRDDTRSDGILALWEAARTHNPARGPEIAHVIRTINWRLIDRHRDRHGRSGTPGYRTTPDSLHDLPTALADPADRVDLVGELVDGLAVHQVLDALPDRHRDVLVAHYLDGQPFSEIGRARGISESGAFLRVSTALEVARRVSQGLPATTRTRPSEIPCESCGRPVPVKATGRMPRFCRPSHAPRTTKPAPHLPAQRSRWGASCVPSGDADGDERGLLTVVGSRAGVAGSDRGAEAVLCVDLAN